MNMTDVKLILAAAAAADDTVLMEGLHGIGKSQVVGVFAEEVKYHMETLFLSHQEVGDLIGMPRTFEIDGEVVTLWTKPIWLQRMEKYAAQGIPTILFLDELNRAPIDVRQSALQLVLERQIHEHKLPEVNGQRCLIVAAINPADEYQVDELDPALLDRFLTLEVEVDPVSWLDWSRANGVNEIVRAFIKANPTKLHYTPKPQKDGKRRKGATPRSWTKLGKFIDNIQNISADVHLPIIQGKIGFELASQFIPFMNNYIDIVTVEDVEEFVKEMSKKTKNVEKLGEGVAELLSKVEAIQKADMIKQMSDKYIGDGKNPTPEEALPFMALLYSMELELLNSYLRSFKAENKVNFNKLRDIDKVLNNKKIFSRVVDKLTD